LLLVNLKNQLLKRQIDKLDRVDSSKEYIKGNIQFVSLISQYAKNNWNENVIFEFAKAVENNSIY
jgi:hypothetical protein